MTIRPPAGSIATTSNQRRRTVDWYNVVMNVALAAFLLLLFGIVANAIHFLARI